MTDNNITPINKVSASMLELKGVTPVEIDEQLVERVERILANVKSGEILGLAFVAFHSDRGTTVGSIGKIVSLNVIGELNVLLHHLIDMQVRLNSTDDEYNNDTNPPDTPA